MLALAITLVLAMVASTVGLADAQQDQVQRDQASDRSVRDTETLRLACNPKLVGDQRGVLCEWSEATNPHTRAYQLYRIVDGSARELLTTVTPDGRRAYFDRDVSAPSTLVYGVISLNSAGRLIGRSAPVHVQYGDQIEELRMACAAESHGDQRGVLCRWSEPQTSRVRGYVVYRAINDGPRDVIARIPADGRQAHFDTNVVPGAIHIYAVTAVDASGHVQAVAGPSRLQWPAAD